MSKRFKKKFNKIKNTVLLIKKGSSSIDKLLNGDNFSKGEGLREILEVIDDFYEETKDSRSINRRRSKSDKR